MEWLMEDRIERALVKQPLRNGRSVAKQPATIPAPGSIVDQMAILVAFPAVVSFSRLLWMVAPLTKEILDLGQSVHISKPKY